MSISKTLPKDTFYFQYENEVYGVGCKTYKMVDGAWKKITNEKIVNISFDFFIRGFDNGVIEL